MRTSESPFLADWFAILMRWLCLLGLTAGLSWSGALNLPLGVAIFVMAIWNCYLSILAISNRRMPAHRPINVAFDMISMLVLYLFSGGLAGAIPWVGVLPLFSTAFYYNLLECLLAGLAVSLLQIGVELQFGSLAVHPMPALGVAVAAFNLLVGLMLGLVGRQLVEHLRVLYFSHQQRQQEAEQKLMQQERDRLQAFYDLTATLSNTLNYQTVLSTALDLGTRLMDDNPESADQMVSAALLFEEGHLKVGSSRRMGPNDQRLTLPGREGLIAETLNSAEPFIGADPASDPELGRFTSLIPCRSLVCHALRGRMNVYGVLLFAHHDADHFTSEKCKDLEVMSRQAVIAIQNALLYQDLEQEKERIIETQEEARKKLARDLHDGPTQSVSAVAMRVNFVRRLVGKDDRSADEELGKIEDLARRTTKEIRHMLFTLRPLVLESQGLVPALLTMADKMKETYSQEVLIDVEPSVVSPLEIGKQTVMFYLIEEAVNNARKYAQAQHIWVRVRSLKKEKEIALLEIQDDGVGFDVEEVNRSYEQRGSLGMVNLRERTELLNGLLHILSANGQGTRVQVFIPLSEDAADRLHRDA